MINDPELFIKLEIPDDDAEVIKLAIKVYIYLVMLSIVNAWQKRELEDNLEWRNISEIGAIMNKQKVKLDEEKQIEDEKAKYQIELASFFTENVNMSKEDSQV